MGVPDVVREDEDHRALLVAAATAVAEDGGGGETEPLDLLTETLEELAPALGPATSLAGRRANEDLS